MVGSSVLLTATVILFASSYASTPVTSASKGKWPPSCFMTSLPFTHCLQVKMSLCLSHFTKLRVHKMLDSFPTVAGAGDRGPLSGQDRRR